MEDEVRDESLAVVALQSLATLVLQCLLGVKLLALLQFQVFQQLLQFQLTEVTLHLYFASQRTRQTVGCLTDFLTLLHVNLDGFVQTCQRLGLLFLGLVEGFLHVLQTLLQGVYDFRYLFLVLHAQLLLAHLQHLLGCGLHLFTNQVQLTLHLLLVHLLQGGNLALMSLLRQLQLLFVGSLQRINLLFINGFLRIQFSQVTLRIVLLYIALCGQLHDVVTHGGYHDDGYDDNDDDLHISFVVWSFSM